MHIAYVPKLSIFLCLYGIGFYTLQNISINIYKTIFTILFLLLQAKMEVDDLFVDLADGIKLLKLLEIISGEKLGKPNSGRMRVHKIENVNKSLAFLHTKVSSFFNG